MKYVQSKYNIIIEQNDKNVYLYNSYSGAFAKLEKEVFAEIENKIIEDIRPCLYFDKLLEQGFIKPIELDEYNKILMIEKSVNFECTEDKLTFVIAPTLSCNLNCVYCFENGYRSKKFMSEETMNNLLEFLENKLKKHTKTIHITWFGGEPLLAYETIIDFNKKLNYFIGDKAINYTSSMISNGILFTADKAKYLAEECNLQSIQITIDGTEEVYCKQKGATHQQFKQVLQNIKDALKYLKVNVRFNSKKKNYEDIISIANHLVEVCGEAKNLNLYLAKLVDYSCSCDTSFYTQEEFDIKSIDFNKYVCKLLGREYKPTLPKYRKNFCGLFKLKNLVIGPDGEFYKCEHYVGRNDKVIGNIKQGLFYTDELFNFLNNRMYVKCEKCKLFPLCIGGCPAQKQDLNDGEACCLSLEYITQVLKTYINY